MSNAWVTAAYNTRLVAVDRAGRPTEKAVLVVLADHADEDGFSWPRVRTIAHKTELSERAVRGALTWLENEEYIERTPWFEPPASEDADTGRQTSNVYRLTNLTNPPVSEGCTPRRGGVQQVQARGARAAGTTRTPSGTPSGRSTTRSSAARPKRRVQGEDHGDDESPALGASPRREPPAEESTPAKLTPMKLAMRLQRKLAGQPGSAATVDRRALASQLSKKVAAGTHTIEQLEQCVELYASSPERYRSGDMKGWTQFLAALPKLEREAETVQESEQGGSRYGGAYDGVTE